MAFIMKDGVLDTYLPEKDESVVTIPAGVHTIGERAFYKALTMEELIVPEGVRVIGRMALARCGKLRRVTLPKSLERIEDEAFRFSNALTDIIVPEGADISVGSALGDSDWFDKQVESGQEQVSLGNTLLYLKVPQETDTLTIPGGVHVLSLQRYDDMSHIRRVVFPKGLRELRGELFLDTDVEDFQFPESLTVFDHYSVTGTPWSEKQLETGEPIVINGTLVALQELPDVVFPDNAKHLAFNLFDCIDMETLHIGAEFCDAGFLLDTMQYDCNSMCSLREITISPDNPYFTVKNNCLLSKDGTVLYLMPFGAEQVIIPDGVTECACDLSEILGGSEIETLSFPHSLRLFNTGTMRWRISKKDTGADRTVLIQETKQNAKLETIATEHFLLQLGSKATEITVPVETELKAKIPKGTLITFRDAQGITMRFRMQADWNSNKDEVLLHKLLFHADAASREECVSHLKKTCYRFPLAVYDAIKGSAASLSYVTKNAKKIIPFLIDEEDETALRQLLSLGVVKEKDAETYLAYAAQKSSKMAQLLAEYCTGGDPSAMEQVKTKAKKAAAKAAEPVSAEELTAQYGAVISGGELKSCTPPKKIKELILPDTITGICAGAFHDAKITRLVLPITVKSLPDACFRDAAGINEIEAMGVETVGASAFAGCRNLRLLSFGDALTTVGESGFKDCAKLAAVTFGAGLRDIKWNAFDGCKKLTDVTIAPDCKKFASFEGTVFDSKLTKPVFVPYARGELVLPPTFQTLTKTIIQDKQRITALTFDLRGTTGKAFRSQIKKVNLPHRSVDTITFRTDAQELTLDLSGAKDRLSSCSGDFDGGFPESNTLKLFVNKTVNALLTGNIPEDLTTQYITASQYMGGFGGVCYVAMLPFKFELAKILHALYDLPLDALCEPLIVNAGKRLDEAEKAAANGDRSIQASERYWNAFEDEPEFLPYSLRDPRSVEHTLDLWRAHEDILKTLHPEQLDLLLEKSIAANHGELTSLILNCKHNSDNTENVIQAAFDEFQI